MRDTEIAKVMKKLTNDKMLPALNNVAYTKGDYEKELSRAVLKREAIGEKKND